MSSAVTTDFLLLPKIFAQNTAYYALPDILMSADGDLQVDAGGDLLTDTTGLQAFYSDIVKRILTESNGLKLHKDYGASLDLVIGENITKGLLNTIKSKIHRAITADKRANDADVSVIAMVLDMNTVGIIVAIDTRLKRFTFPAFMLNVTTGTVAMDSDR